MFQTFAVGGVGPTLTMKSFVKMGKVVVKGTIWVLRVGSEFPLLSALITKAG